MKLPSIGFNVGTLALGAAVVFLGPMVMTAAGGVLRSVAKAGIKSGVLLYEKGKEIAVDTKESVEDLAAEARSEVAQEMKAKTGKK